MHTLDQLLSRVVERRGFAIQGADPEALFAKKGDESLLAAWKTDGPLNAADAQMFLQAYEQVHATSGILVAPQGLDAAAKAAIDAAKGVEVWAESRLIHEVGDAFVRDAIDAHPASSQAQAPAQAQAPSTKFPSAPSPFQASASTQAANKPTSKFPSLVAQAASASVVSNAGAAYFMPSKHKNEVPADMHGNIPHGKGGSLGYAWGGMGSSGPSDPGIAQVRSGRHPSRQVDQWGNLVPPGQGAVQGQGATMATPVAVAKDDDAYEIISTPKKGPKPASAAPTAGPAPATNTLQLNVTKEQALAATKAKPGAIVRLALVPHVAFEYDLHLERPGVAPVDAKGALLASSLTGELRNYEGLAFAGAEPTDARKDQEKLQAVDVYEKVKGLMLKTYSKTMNVEREVAGNTVMETVKIVPDPDEMGLQHRGMVYLPVWEITGGGVNAKVDAFTGATLSG